MLFQRKTTVCVKYFGQDCLHKQCLTYNSPPDTFKFDVFNNFGNSKDFNTVLTKIRATNWRKSVKICFT